MAEELKQLFLPGDVVTLRQDIKNKPEMLVVRKETKRILLNNVPNLVFQGLVCRWFTNQGELQEATFNTKDLLKL